MKEQDSKLFEAVKKQNLDLVKEALTNGADINARNVLLQRPISLAIDKKNHEIIDFLLKNGADIQAPGLNNQSTLMTAIDKENLELVRLLLSKGINLEVQDCFGLTALMIAAFKGNNEIVELLLAHNANVNAQLPNLSDDSRLLPFSVPLVNLTQIKLKAVAKRTPLFFASIAGNIETVGLLIKHGAQVSLQDEEGHTALMAASLFGQAKVVELLLAYGANKELENKEGYTALYLGFFTHRDGTYVNRALRVFFENGSYVEEEKLQAIAQIVGLEKSKSMIF